MFDREHQVKHMVLTAVEVCGVCGEHYSLDNLDVIGNRGDLWVLTLRCPRCQKRGFIAALVNSDHEPQAVMPLDMTDDEVEQLQQAEPVSARDVLEMHEFLATWRGGVSRYLGERPE
jgi:hypothetical protein